MDNDFERIIEQKDVRLYRASVILLESNQDVNLRAAGVEYLNPLPVLDDTGRIIGGATVTYLDEKVTAEIVFDYATPERLDLENDVTIYAQPRGLMWPASDPVSFEDFADHKERPFRVGRVKLTAILLGRCMRIGRMHGHYFSSRVTSKPA